MRCRKSDFISGLIVMTISMALPSTLAADEIEYITNKDSPRLGPYVPATAFGDLVFTSGQIAFDADEGKIVGSDVGEQTRQAFENLRTVLETAGSSLEQVLRITVYLQDPQDFAAMNEVYAEFFPLNKPARTTVPGADWGGAILVEVEAIAVRKKN